MFEWLADNSFLILNVIPIVDQRAQRAFPHAFDFNHMQDRINFYGCADPERIPISDMIYRYRSLCEAAGWVVQETAVEPRNTIMNYLLLVLRNGRGHRSDGSDPAVSPEEFGRTDEGGFPPRGPS